MDDLLENSPLLRVFQKTGKPFVSSRNTNTNCRLSRKKGRNAEIQKPLRVLQPLDIAEQKGSEISSSYGAVCKDHITVSCSTKDREKTFSPKDKFPSASGSSSDFFGLANYKYVNHSELMGSAKIKSCSLKTGTICNNSFCKKNDDVINLSSDDENSNFDSANDSVNIYTEHLVTNDFTSSNLKTESSLSQFKSIVKELPDVRCVQQSGYDVVANSPTSEDHASQPVANQLIETMSDNYLHKNIDVCEYIGKLRICDGLPAKNPVLCETPSTSHTPEKQSKCQASSKIKTLQALKSFLSSDEDYSPPPLSKRLLQAKQNNTPLANSFEKDVEPQHIKKDITPSKLGFIKKEVAPLSPIYSKKKGVSPWKDIREEDSEVSSSTESSDGSDLDKENESSGSEDFEQFLLHLKTPVKPEARNPKNKGVITKDFIETDKTEGKKLASATSSLPRAKTKGESTVPSNKDSDICSNYVGTKSKERLVFSSPEDSTESIFSSEPTGVHKKGSLQRASFLASLAADVPDSLADPAAVMYRKQFTKKKEELVKKLYALFNYRVFDEKLPGDMKVTWNPNLTKTAGKCFCQKDPSVPVGRKAWIELAPKILDSADRVRDTIAHEMCHAACWLIHGVHGGHGSLWKFWASRIHQMFPEIPPVTRCHTYKISTKYVYECTGCGGKIGRHSKSVDITKSVCSRCKSKFKLIVNGKSTETSSKPASGFALFVKENYGNLKKKHAGVKHGDIMKMLSAEFSLKAKISA